MTCVTVVPLSAPTPVVSEIACEPCATVASISQGGVYVTELFCAPVETTVVALIPGPEGPQGPIGPDGVQFETQAFTPVDGQTEFVLPVAPADPASVRMWINGQRFRPPTSLVVAANVVTWQSEFMIDSSDEIEIEYK